MISERNLDRMAWYLLPQKIILGGRHDEARRYVVSTVTYSVRWADAVMQQEILGPTLPVLPYKNLK